MLVSDMIFWILAVIILASGIAVVTVRNLVHAALFMVLTFFGISGIYVLLEADFLAVVQVLIYVGAIAVLIIFGVMLTQRDNMGETNFSSPHYLSAAGIIGLLLLVMMLAFNTTNWRIVNTPAPESTIGPIADLMLGKFVIPFEGAAVLLTVAILGAIIISKGARRST